MFTFTQGIYDPDGKPLLIESNNLIDRVKEPLIYASVAFLGAIVTMFGFVSKLFLIYI